MDELIRTVSEKAGINPDQAKTAVNSVIEFFKAKVPMIGEHLQGFINGEGGDGNALANAAGAIKKKLGIS